MRHVLTFKKISLFGYVAYVMSKYLKISPKDFFGGGGGS